MGPPYRLPPPSVPGLLPPEHPETIAAATIAATLTGIEISILFISLPCRIKISYAPNPRLTPCKLVTNSGWQNSESRLLTAMMPSSACARIRGARRSRVFDDRSGTDPCWTVTIPITASKARNLNDAARGGQQILTRIMRRTHAASKSIVGMTVLTGGAVALQSAREMGCTRCACAP